MDLFIFLIFHIPIRMFHYYFSLFSCNSTLYVVDTQCNIVIVVSTRLALLPSADVISYIFYRTNKCTIEQYTN